MSDAINRPPVKSRHIWPWVVAALVMVGVLLATLAIRREAQRIKEQRQLQMPNSAP